MIDVKATLKESEERMEMAAIYLDDQLSHSTYASMVCSTFMILLCPNPNLSCSA